jgi:excisionase family DNA binding protein
MREGVAAEYKITLFRQYGEEEAAHLLAVDLSTLKRWRREGRVPFVNLGERKVRYFGLHIVDILIKGATWLDTQNGPSKSGSST